MKVRIITGLAAASLAIATMFVLQSPLLLCLVMVFSAMAAYELCHTAKIKNGPMIAVAMLTAALVPPLVEYWPQVRAALDIPAMPLLLGYFIVLLALMLAKFEKTRFTDVLFALFASLGVPGAISTLLLIRNSTRAPMGVPFEPNLAVWIVFFTMCSAWLTDVFALFAGVKFGKHKLAPKISPKKTVEGAVGGLLGMTAANVGFAVMFNELFLQNFKINLITIAVISPVIGIVSIIGDLSASVLKRNYGAKDFGRLFPGHGGVMDRFDSFGLVCPFIFALVQLEQSLGLHLFYEVIA